MRNNTANPAAALVPPAVNDEEAYRNNLTRWLDGDDDQRGDGLVALHLELVRNSENSKANRIETLKAAESGQICSVGRRKIAKKIAKNKRCYANPCGPAQGCC